MSHQKNEPATVVVDGIPITSKLTEVLQQLIERDPGDAKNIIARNNLFIMSIPSDDLEQVEKEFFALQNDLFQLLTALENKVDTHAQL